MSNGGVRNAGPVLGGMIERHQQQQPAQAPSQAAPVGAQTEKLTLNLVPEMYLEDALVDPETLARTCSPFADEADSAVAEVERQRNDPMKPGFGLTLQAMPAGTSIVHIDQNITHYSHATGSNVSQEAKDAMAQTVRANRSIKG